jgi:hypothetical protein
VKIKDPFARKMILGSLTFAAVLLVMVSVFTMVYLHMRPKCSDEVVLESASPDRQWIATVMQRRCGEEAPFITHVNLRPANHPIQYGFFSGRAEEGEVFMLEREAQVIHLTFIWDSATQLTIQCFDCMDIRRREEQWGNVAVRYRLVPE